MRAKALAGRYPLSYGHGKIDYIISKLSKLSPPSPAHSAGSPRGRAAETHGAAVAPESRARPGLFQFSELNQI